MRKFAAVALGASLGIGGLLGISQASQSSTAPAAVVSGTALHVRPALTYSDGVTAGNDAYWAAAVKSSAGAGPEMTCSTTTAYLRGFCAGYQRAEAN